MTEEKTIEETKCVGCGEAISEDDGAYPTDDGLLCESCYEYEMTEPAATVQVDGDMLKISDHINETDGDFIVVWHRLDGWRGYYEVVPHNGWTRLHSDQILSGSEDAEELRKFDERIEEFCEENGFPLAKAVSRTSNIFCGGYDTFVKEKDAGKIKEFTESMRDKYRNRDRFTETALGFNEKEARTLIAEAVYCGGGINGQQPSI